MESLATPLSRFFEFGIQLVFYLLCIYNYMLCRERRDVFSCITSIYPFPIITSGVLSDRVERSLRSILVISMLIAEPQK